MIEFFFCLIFNVYICKIFLTGCKHLNSGEIYVLGGEPGTLGSGVPGPRIGYMPQVRVTKLLTLHAKQGTVVTKKNPNK